MQITITTRHIDVGEEITNYARQKLEQLEHIWNREAAAHLIIESEKKGFVVEVNLHAGRRQINCRARHRNVQAAIEQAVKKTEKRLKKVKGKFEKRRKRQALSIGGRMVI